MCNFYKTMNKFFKEIFMLIFLGGILGITFGILYILYEFIFNGVTSIGDVSFIVGYLLICITAIFVGSNVNDEIIKKLN